MNKYKFWGLVGGAATAATIFGHWAKLTHQPYADMLLTISMWPLAISGGVLVYFIFAAQQKNK